MDLAKLGPYGKDKSGVVRRLIENGIAAIVETGVVAPRNVFEYGEIPSDTADEEEED
jgi:hypothetical protein